MNYIASLSNDLYHTLSLVSLIFLGCLGFNKLGSLIHPRRKPSIEEYRRATSDRLYPRYTPQR